MHAKIIQKASLLQFIELLLSLTQSGFPLSSALKILSEKKETKHLSEKIISKLENGDTFTKAICTLDNKLKNYETLLITAEETGDINPVLSGITEELSEDDENKKSLITVSLYPIFICFLALILSFILIKYGIP